MSTKILPVTVGPIVGATTGTTVRLWGRGQLELIQSGARRCFGIARLRPVNGRFGRPKYFKMNPNFDMTGVVIFTGLLPETRYVYQMGWFFSDLELEDFPRAGTPNWDFVPTFEFSTGTNDDARPRSFIFGSCRYLLRLFGGSWFDDRGDKTFRSILQQVKAGVQTDCLLMIGDQIYADDLLFLHADVTIDEYNRRYRDAFGQPYIRELMRGTPTYMTLDDHEIEDGWPAASSPRDWMIKYPAAIHAYQTYQMSHSPAFAIEQGRITGTPDHFWYTFEDGCCAFFVMDTRTERQLTEASGGPRMISQRQMDALKLWLAADIRPVKLVVSSIPVFPETRMSNDDKWGGFPDQRSELLDFIRQERIQRVVFLSGDVHSSLTAELHSPGSPDFKVINITSSSFFWPYPHNPRLAFLPEGQFTSTLSNSIYQVANVRQVHATDNFTRVTVNPEQLQVAVYDRKGELLGSDQIVF